jgi:hypothetical protein
MSSRREVRPLQDSCELRGDNNARIRVMDSTIVAAIIGAVAVIAAALVARGVFGRRERPMARALHLRPDIPMRAPTRLTAYLRVWSATCWSRIFHKRRIAARQAARPRATWEKRDFSQATTTLHNDSVGVPAGRGSWSQ